MNWKQKALAFSIALPITYGVNRALGTLYKRHRGEVRDKLGATWATLSGNPDKKRKMIASGEIADVAFVGTTFLTGVAIAEGAKHATRKLTS